MQNTPHLVDHINTCSNEITLVYNIQAVVSFLYGAEHDFLCLLPIYIDVNNMIH